MSMMGIYQAQEILGMLHVAFDSSLSCFIICYRFLGTVDKLGTAYEDKILSFGFGTHIAVPLLRQETEKNPQMSKEEAIALIKTCMDLLYVRDARSGAKVIRLLPFYPSKGGRNLFTQKINFV